MRRWLRGGASVSLVTRDDGVYYKGFMVHAVWLRSFIEVWSLKKPHNEELADQLQEEQSSFEFQYYLVQPENQYGYEGHRCASLKEAVAWIDGQLALTT